MLCLFWDPEPSACLQLRLLSSSSGRPEIGGSTLDSLCRFPITGLRHLTELSLISDSLQMLSISVVGLRVLISGLCPAPQQLECVISTIEGRCTGTSVSCFSRQPLLFPQSSLTATWKWKKMSQWNFNWEVWVIIELYKVHSVCTSRLILSMQTEATSSWVLMVL